MRMIARRFATVTSALLIACGADTGGGLAEVTSDAVTIFEVIADTTPSETRSDVTTANDTTNAADTTASDASSANDTTNTECTRVLLAGQLAYNEGARSS